MIRVVRHRPQRRRRVSVLFSEPKIPQSGRTYYVYQTENGFSALQRAENSSMNDFFNNLVGSFGFSALQRAENSSIEPYSMLRNS